LRVFSPRTLTTISLIEKAWGMPYAPAETIFASLIDMCIKVEPIGTPYTLPSSFT